MNDTIVVDYDPFVMESRVSIVRGEKSEVSSAASSLYELKETLLAIAKENNIYNIILHAPRYLSEQIIEDLQEADPQKKIKIEVL